MIIKIEKLDHQGRGIGFLDKKPVFVPLSLSGDLVDIKITKEKSKYFEGVIDKYIEKSDMYIEKTCPYFEVCGGCDLRHISYDDELKFKENKIKEILNKFTRQDIKVEKIVRCDDINNYRNKVKFSVSNSLGLIKRNTHDIINIDECLLADLKINKIVKVLNTCDLSSVKNITIRASKNVDDVMVIIDASNDVNKLVNKLDKFTNTIIVNNKTIKGKGYNLEDLNGIKYKISCDAFFQVNTNMAVKLYNLYFINFV